MNKRTKQQCKRDYYDDHKTLEWWREHRREVARKWYAKNKTRINMRKRVRNEFRNRKSE